MSVVNRVVAHFLDGRILKGSTIDLSPGRSSFHLVRDGSTVQIRFSEVKAVFFVRDLDGDPRRLDLRGFIAGPSETLHGKKVAVRFADGELVCGYTLSYMPRKDAFFMYPADLGSNNLRIYVNAASAVEVCDREAAEELAQRVLDSHAA